MHLSLSKIGMGCRSWVDLAGSEWRMLAGGLIRPSAHDNIRVMERNLELCRDMETVTFPAGEVLFAEGGMNGRLCILISGGVEVIKGESPITEIRDAGAIFGEISILLGLPHPVSVVALEETTCYVTLGGRDFLEANPKIALAVAELLALRLKGMISYLADMKEQYEDRKDHLGMVDELLLNLAHRAPRKR